MNKFEDCGMFEADARIVFSDDMDILREWLDASSVHPTKVGETIEMVKAAHNVCDAVRVSIIKRVWLEYTNYYPVIEYYC